MAIGSQPGSGANAASAERKKETRRIKILGQELKQFAGKKKTPEVLDYIRENYGKEYDFPGGEYRDDLVANPDEVPEEMKDGGFYLFVGSTTDDKAGMSFIPAARWRGADLELHREKGELYPQYYVLNSFWPVGNRVILLEKKE